MSSKSVGTQPLWEAMMDACVAGSGNALKRAAPPVKLAIQTGYSSMIRAIADRVVQDEPEPEKSELEKMLYESMDFAQWHRWHERRLVRQYLLAEADRAEAGE